MDKGRFPYFAVNVIRLIELCLEILHRCKSLLSYDTGLSSFDGYPKFLCSFETSKYLNSIFIFPRSFFLNNNLRIWNDFIFLRQKYIFVFLSPTLKTIVLDCIFDFTEDAFFTDGLVYIWSNDSQQYQVCPCLVFLFSNSKLCRNFLARSVFGFVQNSSGVPVSTISPPSIKMILSATALANCI